MGAVILAVCANIAFWLLMFLTQSLEVRLGRVPKARPHDPTRYREGFIHIQQYATTSWGDLGALSLLDALAATKLHDGGLSLVAFALSLAAGAAVGIWFH
ncbi:MAG: hypothetical protein Q8P12_04465, partial [bacterium]|nr:hypothetical protein [bacterium]